MAKTRASAGKCRSSMRWSDRRKAPPVSWITPRFTRLFVATLGIALANVWFFRGLELGPLCAVPVGLGALRLCRARAWALASTAALLWTLLESGSANPWFDFVVRLTVLGAGVEAIGALRARLRVESRLAETDCLTGALNKRGFARRARESLVEAREHRWTATLVVLDIDDFKRINDTYGHPAGDAVLRLVVAVLRSELRPADVVARLGGDEIVILLVGPRPREAEDLVYRLRVALLDRVEARMFRVTFSIGAIAFPRAPKAIGAMFAAADKLMYQVKRSGKNGIRFGVVGVDWGGKRAFVV